MVEAPANDPVLLVWSLEELPPVVVGTRFRAGVSIYGQDLSMARRLGDLVVRVRRLYIGIVTIL